MDTANGLAPQPNDSTSLKEIENPKDDAAKKRKRHSPQRYGDVGQLDVSESSESTASHSSDCSKLSDLTESTDSFSDIDFVAPNIMKSPKAVATVTKKMSKLNPAKKTKTAVDSELLNAINLDDDFDALSKSVPSTSASPAKIEDNFNSMPIVISDEIRLIDRNKINFGEDVMDVCQRILNQMTDIAARFSVIEELMLENGSWISKDKKPSVVKKTKDNHVFIVSNHLPLRNMDDLNAFENNLGSIEFKNVAAESLANIPNMEKTIGNQRKMLKTLFYNVMEPEFSSDFTMTGKTIPGGRKEAFEKYNKIVDLFYDIVTNIDESYTKSKFLYNLTHVVLKYTHL